MNIRILTAIILVIYLVIAWLGGSILQLAGARLWVFRGTLFLIGIVGAVFFLWFYSKRHGQTAGGVQHGPGSGDLDLVLRTAEIKLKSSKLGRTAKLGNLPVVIFLGEQDSAKTTMVVQSGTEPEIVAGQVYRDNAVAPTESANCWIAKGRIFIEAAGKLLDNTSSWAQLTRRLRPGRLGSLFGKGQPSRVAVICVSCEDFLQAGASAALEGLARKLRSHLDEIASKLGARLPVYVLFTKADRIPFFPEYVRNLSADEASQVVGATLAIERDHASAVYAERATERIGGAFRNLVYSLADWRPNFLAREHDTGKLDGVYEFPREISKLRTPMVKFLVDVCRPSQLRTAPFLRGFYFTGVRAVVLDERKEQLVAAPLESKSADDIGATRIFRAPEAARQRAAAPAASSRKVPQWTFASHFFNDVLLKDSISTGDSGSSTQTASFRRVLLAGASLLLLVLAIGMTVSYFGNRTLQREVLDASRALLQSPPASGDLASREDLARLETLRQSVQTLSSFERDGAPWRLRWGMYSGSSIYPDAKNAYFTGFDALLLRGTQANILSMLKALPPSPSASDDYSAAYDALKAYLMTTAHHDMSTAAFLSPVLIKWWSTGRNAAADQLELAQKQFDFYAEELRVSNPYSSENDAAAVDRARRYLSQFAGMERVYQAMLMEASQKNPPINFNARVPGAATVLINNKEVSGAFSKGGWTFVDAGIKNADRFFSGEQWVLGAQAASTLDRGKLEQDLRSRYTADFIAQWRAFLTGSAITRYSNVGDAARKLNQLSGNQSPLLALLQLVSDNTAVDSQAIKTAFQPVQLVMPPGSAALIGPANNPYMGALLGLQASLDQIANSPGGTTNDALLSQAAAKASEAKVLTRQVAQKFTPDPEGRMDAAVQKLMEDPITNAEALVRNILPGELNGQGRRACTQIEPLMSKFPFNPRTEREATLQEMSAVFDPQQGSLWQFYNANLSKHLTRQGSQFVENPAGGIRLTAPFIAYWNRVAAFSAALYPEAASQPKVPLTLRLVQNRNVDSVTLRVEGQTLTGRGSSPMQFAWTGGGQPVTLNARIGGIDFSFGTYNGPWALFKFFADSENWTASGTTASFEKTLAAGGRAKDVTRISVKFELDTSRAPMFQKDYLAGLRCVSDIARP